MALIEAAEGESSTFWLWRESNQNTGAVKAPLDESQGAVERAECRPGFRGSGVRPVVNELTPLGLSGPEPTTLPHQPHQHRHNDILLPQMTGAGSLKHTTLPEQCAHHICFPEMIWTRYVTPTAKEKGERKSQNALYSAVHLCWPTCVCVAFKRSP